jgi:murein L,D-transpeptidase YafK
MMWRRLAPHNHGVIGRPAFASAIILAGLFLLLFLSARSHSANASTPVTADDIVIVKSQRAMMLLRDGKVLKTYKVALGTQPVGAKERVGDHKTPEGAYVIDSKKEKSQFYKALHVSYPNATDRERARKLGVSPGGDVEIHGLGAKWGWVGARHREIDWTDGCIAVTNEEIDEIFPMVPVGTRVQIKP